jgi:hypothetical protein
VTAVQRARQALYQRYGVHEPTNRAQRRFYEQTLNYERRKDLIK